MIGITIIVLMVGYMAVMHFWRQHDKDKAAINEALDAIEISISTCNRCHDKAKTNLTWIENPEDEAYMLLVCDDCIETTDVTIEQPCTIS